MMNLDKRIKGFKDNLAALQGINVQLDKFLKEANFKVTEREKAISNLNKENAGLSAYKKEVNTLRKFQEELNLQITQLTINNKDLNNQLLK